MEANTRRLRDWLRAEGGPDLQDFEALRRWSVEHVEDFWQALWTYFGVQSPTPHERVLSGHAMPGARWFEGAQVNYAGHLRRHVEGAGAAGVPAVVFRNERLQAEGRSEEIAWPELLDQAAALAATLRAQGVERGDRVAAYLPNIPQALVAFLACASLGAVWTLCAPDMGLATVRDRFRQVDAKVLIACDGSVYGGKTADRRELVASLLQELPTVRSLVLVPYLESAGASGGPFPFEPGAWQGRVVAWDEALAGKERVAPEPVPFSHPLWIVYSSGTTGLPKPIVHGHGGVMLEMLKLHAFHLNLQPSAGTSERFHWYSSSGWVMWNLAVSALLLGTTVCIYDGHPACPQADTLWRFADQVGLSFLGAGAAFYTSCMKAGIEPRKNLRLEHLRALGSTGSPLPPQAYEWGDQAVKPGIWWAVISGGTDLASAFLGGTPELPTVAGEMQARCLGADIHAWNEQGQGVIDDVGELVCVQPMPSMPLFFWGDQGNKRYLDSYFDVYPGVWRHGDWLRITPAGSTVVYGRSDATLNRHGHRLGTSELYRVVEAIPEVLDSLVVDIEFLGRPSFMPLFVVLRPGVVLDAPLQDEIRKRIRQELSPRFVPDEVRQVAEIPRTLTGKKQELPVKKLMLGRRLEDVVNKDACANPQAFDWFADYARRHAA
ncbi:acetoacetate--CoA ligase [Ramlibacter agri]|uniref:acetoacetate--CoA ligase n=1 Tax=Ramlibacter agri TaxID=2728837 RepID=UPI00315B1AD6